MIGINRYRIDKIRSVKMLLARKRLRIARSVFGIWKRIKEEA